MDSCIFCKIGRGEIGASVVYEDDTVVAFDDINPQAPVHALVIPREHFEGLASDVPVDVLAALLRAVPKVAAAKGVDRSGYRTIINTGPDAGQSVPHLHLHVLGGKPMGEGLVACRE